VGVNLSGKAKVVSSSLTSASLKSGFFSFFLLFAKNPSVHENLNRHAFKLNFSAFSNGIKFANYKFIAQRKDVNEDYTKDVWLDKKVGLDFNLSGFPIGTEFGDKSYQLPQTAKDCLQLWNFVLGSLKPKISILKNKHDYWVLLNEQGECEYRDPNVAELFVMYDANEGKVKLIDNSD
jgi:hypothetical protein